MGKEIRLTFCVAKAGFPSGSKLGAEVLRMHELQTCEIPLLWRSGSTVWSAAPPVCAMPPHLDGAPEKAGGGQRIGRQRPCCTAYWWKASPFHNCSPSGREWSCRRIGIDFAKQCCGLFPGLLHRRFPADPWCFLPTVYGSNSTTCPGSFT